MNRTLIALMTALAFAGCSGGGGSSGGGTLPTTVTHTASSVSVALGTATSVGGTFVFPVTVTAIDSTGATVTGSYTQPVTLSTSDATDTGFSSSASGSSAQSSIAVTSSTQIVYFVYTGTPLTSAVTITVTDPTAPKVTYAFGPFSTTSNATIASISIAANGAIPQSGTAGSFILNVAAYTASGALITGTYNSPVVITTNDSTDLKLSVNGGAPASGVTVTSPSQIVLVSYDGASIPAGTVISASAAGASSVSVPFSPAAPLTSGNIAALSLAQVGALPNQGTAGQFALVITATNAANQPIAGTYPQNVVISSNDAKDLTFSTTPAGPFSASVSVPNSSTVVYVSYDGAQVPTSTQFSASAGTTVGTLVFNPAAQVTSAPYIATLYVTTAGAPPEAGSPLDPIYAAQPVYISAVDQNGNTFNGTYPSVVRMTVNNATDLQLTIGSYAPATICQQLPQTQPCPNIAAVVINGSGQAVFADYVDEGVAGYPLEAPNPDISITTDGIQCASIQFPLAANGSSSFTCQPLNPASVVRKSTSIKNWQFVPVAPNRT